MKWMDEDGRRWMDGWMRDGDEGEEEEKKEGVREREKRKEGKKKKEREKTGSRGGWESSVNEDLALVGRDPMAWVI